jgi:hypothetical protein
MTFRNRRHQTFVERWGTTLLLAAMILVAVTLVVLVRNFDQPHPVTAEPGSTIRR